MRIVCTSDTHYPFSPDQIPDGDVFIHGGDVMYTGYLDEWHPRVESFAALSHKHKLLVPGNHDYHIQNYEGVARAELRKAGVRVVGTAPDFARQRLPNGMMMLGIPYVTGLNGWAFCRDEVWLLDYLRSLDFDNNYCDVIVSHAPMFNVLDAIFPEQSTPKGQEHVGGLAMNKWYYELKRKPKVWINGHIHESYGRHLTEDTAFYNVAMCDRNYDQVNAPQVIDL